MAQRCPGPPPLLSGGTTVESGVSHQTENDDFPAIKKTVLSTVTSQGCGVTSLIIGSYIDMSGVDPELLGKLERLVILGTNLKQQQLVVIFTGVSEGRKMEKLDIGWNNLSRVYPGL